MKRFLQLILLSSLSFAVAVSAGQFNKVINIGDPLPEFSSLPDTAGNFFSSSDFKGKVLVIVSLSNMCPFSKRIESDLKQLVSDYSDKPVNFVGINFNANRGDDLNSMKTRAKAERFNFTYLRDEDQHLGRQLGTSVTPEFFVFGPDRTLAYTGLLHNSPAMERSPGNVVHLKGPPAVFYVRDSINALLSGQPAPLTETQPYGCSVEYRREAK